MDQQVSPAVVVIVLILIAAILVGLYFLVVDRKPQATEEPPVDVTAGEAAPPMQAEPGAEPAAELATNQEQADQSDTAPVNSGPETSVAQPADPGPSEPAGAGGGG